MDPSTWWPGWRPTPAEHRTTNPDVWRRRLSSHIDEAQRQFGRHSHETAATRQFTNDLDHSAAAFQTGADTAQVLEGLHAIGARAFTYLTANHSPGLDGPINGLRFDLAGLAEVLTDPYAPARTRYAQ